MFTRQRCGEQIEIKSIKVNFRFLSLFIDRSFIDTRFFFLDEVNMQVFDVQSVNDFVVVKMHWFKESLGGLGLATNFVCFLQVWRQMGARTQKFRSRKQSLWYIVGQMIFRQNKLLRCWIHMVIQLVYCVYHRLFIDVDDATITDWRNYLREVCLCALNDAP